MRYPIDSLSIANLLAPVVETSVALTRLDERLQASPVGQGWIERSQFADAAAALWLEGELVQLEDLVLHDERMDVRAPTHELTRAHTILRARRRISAAKPDWALSPPGLRELAGLSAAGDSADKSGQPDAFQQESEQTDGDESEPASDQVVDEEDPLASHFAALDAVLARTSQLLDGATPPPRASASPMITTQPRERPTLIYDLDWDEEARMAEWVAVLDETSELPVMLRAAILLDAWGQIEVLQHGGWLGGLLVASLLRREGLTGQHLACLHLGSRNIARERRRSPDRTRRLLALLESMAAAAELGLKQHDRLVLAKAQMEQRLKNRRSSSKLPDLVALVLSRPLVTAPMIEKRLKVTQQGALNLIDELALREMTGRKRFRAWGVL